MPDEAGAGAGFDSLLAQAPRLIAMAARAIRARCFIVLMGFPSFLCKLQNGQHARREPHRKRELHDFPAG
jgi:hypothetical protein